MLRDLSVRGLFHKDNILIIRQFEGSTQRLGVVKQNFLSEKKAFRALMYELEHSNGHFVSH